MKNLLLTTAAIFLLSSTAFSQNDCDPISTFPWAEGFENNGTEIPLCWESWHIPHYPALKWAVVPDSIGAPPTAYEGNFKARVSLPASGHYIQYCADLYTPVFDLSKLDYPVLSFWHAQNATGNGLGVFCKTHPNGTWTLLKGFANTHDWQHSEITLGYTSYYSNYQIAFSNGYSEQPLEIQLDDIKIMGRSQYIDATLSNLSISKGVLNPEFSSNIRNYTINVVDAEEITITAMPTNQYATVNGTGTFLLEAGQNIFTVNVVAADGVTKLDYEIMVNPVGVMEIETSLVKIYPNPTIGELRITNYELRIEEIIIFDVYGRKVSSYQVITEKIDIGALSSGVYFVKVRTDKGEVVKRVVKE